MKREVITGVLLVIIMAPALVQAAAPAQENDMRPLDDTEIWVRLGQKVFEASEVILKRLTK